MFYKTILSTLILSFSSIQAASAASFSVTTGQSDFNLEYKVNNSTGSFEETFNYYNIGLSADRGGYTFGLNFSGLLEDEAQETFEGEADEIVDVNRDAISLSVSRPMSDNLFLSGGYYVSEVTVSDQLNESADDTIETQALFASLTRSGQLTEQLLWFGRFGAQINQAELTVHPNDEPTISQTLDGYAFLLGAGIVYPLTGTASLTFGAEYKEFIYDGGSWDLDEEQALFTAGYNYRF